MYSFSSSNSGLFFGSSLRTNISIFFIMSFNLLGAWWTFAESWTGADLWTEFTGVNYSWRGGKCKEPETPPIPLAPFFSFHFLFCFIPPFEGLCTSKLSSSTKSAILLKIKIPNIVLWNYTIEEPPLIPYRTFQWMVP